ncbi:UNVERIFIED_CONTAM: Plasmodesmata-located protein 4 [Sesamum angustifolium]|uniref:Plasmodesmata-located protein 4 n=1 Tax=Sesamum angustifolium TaxID=2727405 RepID=A0AAW2IPV3_9LAMI
MDLSTNSCTLTLCFVLILQSVNSTLIIDGHHKLIYNQCSNQSTSLNPYRSSLLSGLFQEFIAQSSQSRFFQTIVADDETAISGRFQCRNDLTPEECRSCVSNFQALSEDLCGKNLPARIQLSGCYVHYQEEDGAEADPGTDRVLHQACSKHRVKKNGYEEMKYAALAALDSCVVSGNGFCETTYEAIHVVGQCAGSLRACDCGACVDSAARIAEDECRYSVSGEIYLDGCFVSYEYNGGHGFGSYSFEGMNRAAFLLFSPFNHVEFTGKWNFFVLYEKILVWTWT